MLILTQQGMSVKIAPQPFGSEDALQHYISKNPAAIPLGDGAEPRELHVLGREFSTPSGPIDVLGTDMDGHPYIIETKLHKNPDKRFVLAQVLDYGAALWSEQPAANDVIDRLRADALKRGVSDPIANLALFLDGDEGVAISHIERICTSLAAGRFTAVVLMDHLPERLKDLILFMNAKSEFRLLAVELEYYKHGQTEIAYPKLFGAESRSPGKLSAKHNAKPNSEQFLAGYADRMGSDAVSQWRSFLESMLSIPGVAVSHLPAGTPYIYLTDTPFGDVRLFRLADNAAEIRDLLHQPEVFSKHSDTQALRTQFRDAIVSSVSGSYRGGSVGRVYIPLTAAQIHAPILVEEVARLGAALRSQSVDVNSAIGA